MFARYKLDRFYKLVSRARRGLISHSTARSPMTVDVPSSPFVPLAMVMRAARARVECDSVPADRPPVAASQSLPNESVAPVPYPRPHSREAFQLATDRIDLLPAQSKRRRLPAQVPVSPTASHEALHREGLRRASSSSTPRAWIDLMKSDHPSTIVPRCATAPYPAQCASRSAVSLGSAPGSAPSVVQCTHGSANAQCAQYPGSAPPTVQCTQGSAIAQCAHSPGSASPIVQCTHGSAIAQSAQFIGSAVAQCVPDIYTTDGDSVSPFVPVQCTTDGPRINQPLPQLPQAFAVATALPFASPLTRHYIEFLRELWPPSAQARAIACDPAAYPEFAFPDRFEYGIDGFDADSEAYMKALDAALMPPPPCPRAPLPPPFPLLDSDMAARAAASASQGRALAAYQAQSQTDADAYYARLARKSANQSVADNAAQAVGGSDEPVMRPPIGKQKRRPPILPRNSVFDSAADRRAARKEVLASELASKFTPTMCEALLGTDGLRQVTSRAMRAAAVSRVLMSLGGPDGDGLQEAAKALDVLEAESIRICASDPHCLPVSALLAHELVAREHTTGLANGASFSLGGASRGHSFRQGLTWLRDHLRLQIDLSPALLDSAAPNPKSLPGAGTNKAGTVPILLECNM